MKITLLYYSRADVDGLLEMIKQETGKFRIKEFEALADLSEYLGKPRVSSQYVIVVSLANSSEMNQLLKYTSLLEGIDLVLVLSEGDEGLAEQAHLLQPRVQFTGRTAPESVLSTLKRIHERRLPKEGVVLQA